jgi:hypothetical protein
MDDVLRRLQQERAGTYQGLPRMALNEIPIPSGPILFEFQAPIVNQVTVVLALPPNDVMHKADFPDMATVEDVVKYAKKQFQADPARNYGARVDDEFDDDNWYPLQTRLSELDDPAYLWIREVPSDTLPSLSMSTSQRLAPLSPRTNTISASCSGSLLRPPSSQRRSGLNSPRGPPIIRPTPGSGRPVVPIKVEPPAPKPVPGGEPKGHDYGARLSELVFRSGKDEEECVCCFNFFKYDFNAALEALTAL